MSRLGFSVLQAAALAVVLAASCVNETTDDDDNDSAGSTGGSKDDGTGGKSETGGDEGTGGTSGETGGSGNVPEGAVKCPTPTQALITDFTPAEDVTDEATFGDFTTTFSGGTLVYPDTITSDVSGNAWHVSGTVEDYTGFGFYFSVPSGGCGLIDASAYKGFTFSVKGTLPEGRTLTMWVSTAANTVSYEWFKAQEIDEDPGFGRCQPQSDNQYDGTCKNGETQVPLSDSAETVTLKWSDFVGGKPEATVNPAEITRFGFYVSWRGADDTAYDFDITFDDLSFLE